MSENHEIVDSRLEARQGITLLVLAFLPVVLGNLNLLLSPKNSMGYPDIGRPGLQQYFGYAVFIASALCALAIPIFVLLAREGIGFSKIKAKVSNRDFDKYVAIAFVPVVVAIIFSWLQYKGDMVWRFGSQGQAVYAQSVWQWAFTIVVTIKSVVFLLSLAGISSSQLRRGFVATALLGRLVLQEVFGLLARQKFGANDDSFAMQHFLPQMLTGQQVLLTLALLAIYLTFTEVFRPSLKIFAIFVVIDEFSKYFLRASSDWFALAQYGLTLLFVLTAWQLRSSKNLATLQ